MQHSSDLTGRALLLAENQSVAFGRSTLWRLWTHLCRSHGSSTGDLSFMWKVDGTWYAYHDRYEYRGIRVRFRRGSMRYGYHIQGRQQTHKCKSETKELTERLRVGSVAACITRAVSCSGSPPCSGRTRTSAERHYSIDDLPASLDGYFFLTTVIHSQLRA